MLAHARSRARQRDHGGALYAYRALTQRHPDCVEGWFERSGSEKQAGNTLTAITAGRSALALAPGNATYRANLAQLQVSYGLSGDAVQTLTPLLERQPGCYEPRIANAIGSVLSLAGLETQAQPWFEFAATAAPEQRNYAFNAAQGLAHCGRLPESLIAFDHLLQAFPDFAKAHWARAALDTTPQERHVDGVRHILPHVTTPSDEVYCCFALFSLLDAMDRRQEAFVELEHGMKLQRALLRYKGDDHALLRRLEHLGARLACPAPHTPLRTDSARPLFIVGLPRSGTTMVERILSNHPDVAQGGEFVCFSAAVREQFGIEMPGFVPSSLVDALAGDADWAALGDRYLKLTEFKHQGFTCFTDKLPFNFMLLPWIAKAVPHARFLHVQRDPMDTCFSNLKQLFSQHYAACYSQQDIAEYYRAYHEIMHSWERLLPGRILQIRYETLVTAPERETQRMFDFCGLSSHVDAWRIEKNAKPVATASAAQVRGPINTRSLGAWRRYETQLRHLSDFFSRHPQLAS